MHTGIVVDFTRRQKSGVTQIVGYHDRRVERSKIKGGNRHVIVSCLGGDHDGALVAFLLIITIGFVHFNCSR